LSGKVSKPHVSALLVAVGRYNSPAYEPLNEAPEAARALAEVLAKGGYTHAHAELLDGGDTGFIASTLDEWLRSAGKGDTVLLYWTGHGKREGDGHFLVTKNSPSSSLTAWNTLSASDLGSAVAKSPAEKVLILLDTCYSGAGAADIADRVRAVLATRPEQRGRRPTYAVIASAHPLKKAKEAVFCKALTRVLSRPPAIDWGWADNDQFIQASDLAVAIEIEVGEDHHVEYVASGPRQRFIPNPRYRGELPAADVETRRRRLEAAEEHFLPASRGVEIGEAGWYFSGRTRVLSQLVEWLKHAEHGAVVVTGPAGSGKSAVIGRLATLSDVAYRAEAERVGAIAGAPPETLPPEGFIDMAVHLKGKTLFDCIGAVADSFDIALSDRDRADPKALIRAFGNFKRRVTLLFDALDEAKPGHPHGIGERLIKPLAMLAHVRVLIGTRRSPDGATIPAGKPRHARLRALFGADALILDLEDELQTPHDIAQYVRLRLRDSRHKNDLEGIERIANAIAEKAVGIFLYARIACRTLQDTERLDIDLPSDALGVFVGDLTRRFGEQSGMVNDVLAALAWSEGRGLTRRPWALVANTLSWNARYGDGDVAWVLENAGWHIIEAGEDGQAVYRLAHQSFADYYRSRADSKDANVLITQALAAGIKGKDWLDADGYLWRHLASHAAAGRVLDTLVTDVCYLAVAEPFRLLPGLATLTDGRAREIAEVYRRVVHELPMMEPLERMALIHLIACQEAPLRAPDLKPPLSTAWLCRWARWMPSAPNRILGHHTDCVCAVELGLVDGEPVVVSGSSDKTVRLWDARTGRPRGEPLTGHSGSVTAVALGEVDGEPVVVSGSEDRTVRLWDARTGRPRGELQIGHAGMVLAVVLGEVNGEPVVVSASSSDKTVRLWDARTGRRLGEPSLTCHTGPVNAVALGEVDGQPVVVSGSGDQMVRLWDARTGRPRGTPLIGHADSVLAVALGEVDGEPIVVSASSDRTVRLWDGRSCRPHGEPLTGHAGTVVAVALGEVDGEPVVVSGSADDTVRLWDARTGRLCGTPLSGHSDSVNAVVLGEIDGEPVVASGSSDHTVRLWDARTGQRRDTALNGQMNDMLNVHAVALGEVDGEPVVVSGSSKVQLWDVRTGRPRGEPLTGHTSVVDAVALGEVDGQPVVVSKSFEKVRLWDARTGRPLGEFQTMCWREAVVALGQVDGEPVVVVCGADRIVTLWDARAGQYRRKPLTVDTCCKMYGVFSVKAMVLGEVDGEPVVVSGNRETVQIRDARTGRPCGEPLTGHAGTVVAVALGEVDGEPVVVSGSGDETVRLWDARARDKGAYSMLAKLVRPSLRDKRYEPRGEPLTGHAGTVVAVALGEVDGEPVVVSGGEDRTVRLWDARSHTLLKMIPLKSQVTGLAMGKDSAVAVSTTLGIVMLDF
jgi:WD40 repeat protein